MLEKKLFKATDKVSVLADIQTGHLQNMSWHYCYTDLNKK